MTDSADPIDAAEDADASAANDADCSGARKSRKRPARDPVERYLKALRVGRSPGFLSILGLLFVTLKLTGQIDWSWLWVLTPFLIKGSFMLLFVVGIVFALKKTGWKPSGDT